MYHQLVHPQAAAMVLWLLSDGERGSEGALGFDGWQAVADYAEANGLGSVVARKVIEQLVPAPETVIDRLVRLDEKLGRDTDRVMSQAALVDSALCSRGIKYFWLKGASWGSSLYTDVGVRPMRDLDFIVPHGELEMASGVLTELGYAPSVSARVAGQHLPQMVHLPSRTKIDLHHRIVPASVYGFPVGELSIPWNESHGVIGGAPNPEEALFHLAHMIIHAFHHSFYNLRAMHLFDIKLALTAWDVDLGDVVEGASTVVQREIVLDILGLAEMLMGTITGLDTRVDERISAGLVRNGSLPLGYPLTRIRRVRDAHRVVGHEARRSWFVLRAAPGRFGRPPAALHPPDAD